MPGGNPSTVHSEMKHPVASTGRGVHWVVLGVIEMTATHNVVTQKQADRRCIREMQ